MIGYLLKMKGHVDALASAVHVISEDDQVLYILGGLSVEYDHFIISLTTRIEFQKLKNVCAMVLAHESQINLHHTPTTDDSLQVNILAKDNGQRKSPTNGQTNFQSSSNFNR